MKLLFSLLSLLLFQNSTFVQAQDIQVFERKDGKKNIVVARNIGKTGYTVTLKVTSTGMKVTPSETVEVQLPAGTMKDMVTIEPIPGQTWSYSYEASYQEIVANQPKATTGVPTTAGNAPSILPEEAMIVYTKEGCGRCAMVKKDLTSRGIEFTEVDVNGTSPEVAHMWDQLRSVGYAGASITLPVVRLDGKYHYNIPDLKSFLSKI